MFKSTEAYQTCPICGSDASCDCTHSMTRLLEILCSVEQRVSTHKQTSDLMKHSPVSVAIDKLSFELPSPLLENEVISRLRVPGLGFKQTKLRDRRWYIQVGQPSSGTYFNLKRNTENFCSQLITRPSAFSSFADYINHIKQLFSQDEIESLKITRLDIAIDYREELSRVLRGFDFKQKQMQVSFIDKGGIRTGLRVGKGSEVIQVYDKAIEANLPSPLTRVEIQLSGQKLPARKLHELQKVLRVNTWNPFDQISIGEVSMVDGRLLTASQTERLSALTAILNREGLFSVRRVFNEQGNFLRDYKPFINIQPWREQPNESFRKHFSNFLNSTQIINPY